MCAVSVMNSDMYIEFVLVSKFSLLQPNVLFLVAYFKFVYWCADIPQPTLPAWLSHHILPFWYQGQGPRKEVPVVRRHGGFISQCRSRQQRRQNPLFAIFSCPRYSTLWEMLKWNVIGLLPITQVRASCVFFFFLALACVMSYISTVVIPNQIAYELWLENLLHYSAIQTWMDCVVHVRFLRPVLVGVSST